MSLDDYAPKRTCTTCRRFYPTASVSAPFYGIVKVRDWCAIRQEKVKIEKAETCRMYLEKLYTNLNNRSEVYLEKLFYEDEKEVKQ